MATGEVCGAPRRCIQCGAELPTPPPRGRRGSPINQERLSIVRRKLCSATCAHVRGLLLQKIRRMRARA